jgi:argininosuccinate synthase
MSIDRQQAIVVAFSGGLDTSYCAARYGRESNSEVVTVTIDTGGFSPDELAALAYRSQECGAHRHLTIDGKDQAFNRVIVRLIQGNVLRGGAYPLCVSAERLTQAELLVAAARDLGAGTIVHGSTGAGNDQVRFDVTIQTLAPELEIIAPIREHGLSRQAETDWLREQGIPVSESTCRYSINAGLWGTTIGGGEIHDPWQAIPDDAYPNVVSPEDASSAGTTVTISFDRGVPTALDSKQLDGPSLVTRLNQVGAEHGVGRGIHMGDTILGIKGRIAFEAPAAAILIAAHRELEKLVLTRWQRFWKDQISDFFGQIVHEAMAHDPVFDDIEALLESSQTRVCGEARVHLRRGTLTVEGVRSPYSIVAATPATYGEEQALWDGRDAVGFTRIYGLQGRLARIAAQDQPQ